MKYNKINAILKLHGLTIAKYANFIGVARQSITNKKRSDSFTVDELILLAEMTGNKLAIVNKKNEVVMSFDRDDLQGKVASRFQENE